MLAFTLALALIELRKNSKTCIMFHVFEQLSLRHPCKSLRVFAHHIILSLDGDVDRIIYSSFLFFYKMSKLDTLSDLCV